MVAPFRLEILHYVPRFRGNDTKGASMTFYELILFANREYRNTRPDDRKMISVGSNGRRYLTPVMGPVDGKKIANSGD